ncbi:TetR family transcriptional regulator [Georgfuchsia toluolica]|uniref:TetR family transcriptional regulator n=1 Tax=Georgfuchsia toluolica TaxID=424218 RepID=A0A916N3L0_9PROT|nr:TetR/AcrR family transcriptional regulator [Georgfuchsia toluolica]CAG4885176.1 TetR family transcriptional regulator [Georgfuchsia toluolica]
MVKKSDISQRRAVALAEGGVGYAAKRNELIRVAATLFKDHGYRATTLNDIAQAAGMDRATVYYYVGSKEELLREAVQNLMGQNVSEVEKLVRADVSPQEKLESIIRLLILSYDKNYPHAYVYIQQKMQRVADATSSWAKEMAKQTHRIEIAVESIIREGMKSGVFRDDVPVKLTAYAIFGAVNWTHRWYVPGGRNSPEEIVDAFSKIMLQGLVSRKETRFKAKAGAKKPARMGSAALTA